MPESKIGPLRLLTASPKERLQLVLGATGVACKVRLPDGSELDFGEGPPRFALTFHDWAPLKGLIDEFSLGAAYVDGAFEIEGDMLSLFAVRDVLADVNRFGGIAKLWSDLFLRQATKLNRAAIDWHYSHGDAFYHGFIDTQHRFYSHGIFHAEDESIEAASTHKLEQMFDALELKQGMHLLDVGGGWGPVTAYCCSRGVKVTTLTIAPDSEAYINDMIRENGYDAAVHLQDFLEHTPAEPYDAIVIFGVIEHIPRYRRLFERAWDCLKPGGGLFLDASAALEKYDTSNFTKHYIWRGTHAFMCVQDAVREILLHGFDLMRVKNETRDYELTMRQWARRFDARREEIVERWGEPVYRAFRIYLWGGCHALATQELQAYHILARRRDEPGPRPGNWRRLRGHVAGLA